MRYPRNVKLFRGQLDPAPFACVLFLVLIFLLLESEFIFAPGVRVNLPEAVNLPGTTNRTVVVAVDEGGQWYFRSQVIGSARLAERLSAVVAESSEPVTLVIQADQKAKYQALVELALLARSVGIRDALLATRPSPLSNAPDKL